MSGRKTPGGAWRWEPGPSGLYAPWVPLATGGFVRFYDRHLHPMLKPIRSPFKQEATLEAWDFFRAQDGFSRWWQLKYFYVHPENWVKDSHFDLYFSNGLGKDPRFGVNVVRMGPPPFTSHKVRPFGRGIYSLLTGMILQGHRCF